MLVLSRKVGEVIAIGDQITITVVDVKGGTVRLGIGAPHDMTIYRQEIYLKVQQENKQAADWSLEDLDKVAGIAGVGEKE